MERRCYGEWVVCYEPIPKPGSVTFKLTETGGLSVLACRPKIPLNEWAPVWSQSLKVTRRGKTELMRRYPALLKEAGHLVPYAVWRKWLVAPIPHFSGITPLQALCNDRSCEYLLANARRWVVEFDNNQPG